MSETDTFSFEENILGGDIPDFLKNSDGDFDDSFSNLSGGVGISIIDDIFMLGCCVFYCTTFIICITMIFVINKKTYCK